MSCKACKKLLELQSALIAIMNAGEALAQQLPGNTEALAEWDAAYATGLSLLPQTEETVTEQV